MSTSILSINYWQFDWTSIVVAILLIIFQVITGRKIPARKQLLFYFGIFVLLLVTLSPLAYLGHDYLFSAHMTEHIVLLLIVPPLLLAGTNPEVLEKLHNSRFRSTGEVLFSAPVAWIMGIGAMYFWHIPPIFDAMKHSSALHAVHILSLLLLGWIFIWPVYTPITWKRLSPLQSALYLFLACVGCTILGILITFAPAGIYSDFLAGSNESVWNMIRTGWGITAQVDQQAGGLIMWVPACIIYVTNIMLILAGYYSHPVDDENEFLLK